MPLVIGIEMVRTHHNLGDNSRVMVGVAPCEVSGPSVLHNDPTKVKDHGIDCSLAHNWQSCRLLRVPANWLRGVHR